jgi:hypothetical protein
MHGLCLIAERVPKSERGPGQFLFLGRHRWWMGCRLAGAIWVDLLRLVDLG